MGDIGKKRRTILIPTPEPRRAEPVPAPAEPPEPATVPSVPQPA